MPPKPILKLILPVVLAFGTWSVVAQQQPSPRPAASTVGNDPSPSIEARIERLQARVESVESVRAIKRLQYAYGHYVELGLWNDFADLFTEDAATNYQQGARGRAEIRKLFFDQVGQGKLGLADGRIYPHILLQPVITLAPDGRTAKGRWRILAMLGGYGGSATWYSGVYENEYVQQDGVWKISVLRSEPKATAAYTAAGWRDSGTRIPTHYTAASVGLPVPASAGRSGLAAASTAADGTPADRVQQLAQRAESLAQRLEQLALRAGRLNDQGEVTNLLDAYGYAIDRKQWDQAAALFANDGTMELGQQGVYVGKASIRRGLDQFGTQGFQRDGERNDHVYLQTVVTVAPDGRTAMARGVELIFSNPSSNPGASSMPSASSNPGAPSTASTPIASSASGTSSAELSEGVFENTFVKQDGGWKIQSVHFYPRMIVDAATGWAKSAKPAPGPSKEFPPDRPPTSKYEIYPKFAVAPFHFDNPVTGRPPQYPEGVQAARSATIVPARPNGQGGGLQGGRPQINNETELEARLTEAERSLAAAEVYDAAENLIHAYGYTQDDSPSPNGGTLFVNQILQPVIDIAAEGMNAKVRARRLDLGGTSGGSGHWSAGSLEGQVVPQGSGWRLESPRSISTWSASYPGGWARIP